MKKKIVIEVPGETGGYKALASQLYLEKQELYSELAARTVAQNEALKEVVVQMKEITVLALKLQKMELTYGPADEIHVKAESHGEAEEETADGEEPAPSSPVKH
jgi:hypothetical protein